MSETQDEQFDTEEVQEQYSDKISNIREENGFKGGSLICKYITTSDGGKYGQYAYLVSPPSEGRNWYYVGKCGEVDTKPAEDEEENGRKTGANPVGITINDSGKSGRGETQEYTAIVTVTDENGSERVYHMRNVFDSGLNIERIDDFEEVGFEEDIDMILENSPIPTDVIMNVNDTRTVEDASGDSKADLYENYKVHKFNDKTYNLENIEDKSDWYKEVNYYDPYTQYNYNGDFVNTDYIGVDEGEEKIVQSEESFYRVSDGGFEEISEEEVKNKIGVEISDDRRASLESEYAVVDDEILKLGRTQSASNRKASVLDVAGVKETTNLSIDNDGVKINGEKYDYDDIEFYEDLDTDKARRKKLEPDEIDNLSRGDEIYWIDPRKEYNERVKIAEIDGERDIGGYKMSVKNAPSSHGDSIKAGEDEFRVSYVSSAKTVDEVYIPKEEMELDGLTYEEAQERRQRKSNLEPTEFGDPDSGWVQRVRDYDPNQYRYNYDSEFLNEGDSVSLDDGETEYIRTNDDDYYEVKNEDGEIERTELSEDEFKQRVSS